MSIGTFTNMKTRVEFCLPADKYHADPAIGNSGIRDLMETPYHYWAKHLSPRRLPTEPTPAMQAGTLAHTLILEPQHLELRYVIRPDGLDGRTKEGKAWAAGVSSDHEIISLDQLDVAQRQRDAIARCVPDVSAMINAIGAKTEVSAFWRDDDTGIDCKCRPDAVVPTSSGTVLIDIKTARHVDPRGFSRAIWTFGYHRQAAWYTRGFEAASGVNVEQFIFVVVSTEYPFVAAAYVLDDESLQQGSDECDVALATLAECRTTNTWPAYGATAQPISLPPYARASNEVEVSYV